MNGSESGGPVAPRPAPPATSRPAVPRPAAPQYPAGRYHPAEFGYSEVDHDTARRANRGYWDATADDYQAEHGEFLGDADFLWCPEGLREADTHLLGEIRGRTVLEIGCGGAQCARWLVTHGAEVVALDLSAGQLRHARSLSAATGVEVSLVQADAARLPLTDASVDVACSAFGAIPFVADSAVVMREVARVLRPGGRWVFSTTHPMIWSFPDSPGTDGLTVVRSYFDRRAYVERDRFGRATYTETHRTVGDRVRELVAAGLRVLDLIEPEWPAGHDRVWGQWGPVRGRLFPSTSIFVTEKPARSG
ncbi:class I SAM-dependent methyltransferase [Frankia sp. Cppng1_Ct_nod]|uniref:class I SAM-dependent methyltransferase n=1 Tax=Frankia sp. Cppng1_Ct_nod TaxID=2897162 RepID=UPI001F5F36AB|nr:class I SAM-dependent methyltransferase [Frankia sp. Cppng1_Ct_nod]